MSALTQDALIWLRKNSGNPYRRRGRFASASDHDRQLYMPKFDPQNQQHIHALKVTLARDAWTPDAFSNRLEQNPQSYWDKYVVPSRVLQERFKRALAMGVGYLPRGKRHRRRQYE